MIEVIPLRDPSVKSFAQAYPQVEAAAEALRSALAAKGIPDAKLLAAVDRHTIDAEHSFHARIE